MTTTKKMFTTNDAPCGDAGFNLIELSIVLVLVGLIIGGIFVGRNLINTAKARAFLTQIEKYNSAVNAFKDKFQCLPGDCANGTDYGFPKNGDGDGMVSALITTGHPTSYTDYDNAFPTLEPYFISNSSLNPLATSNFEGDLFWYELSSAGFINGISKIGVDSGGYALNFPLLTISHEWLLLAGWNGSHYYRTGYTTSLAGTLYPCAYSLAPADVYYLAIKYGQSIFNTGLTRGIGDPDATENGDELIVVGDDPACPNDAGYYYPPLMGAGGPTHKFCLNTSTTPPSLNLAYSGKVCNIMLKAQF